MLRYAITDAARNLGSPADRLAALRATCSRWASEGVDLIQLREKSLGAGELYELARNLRRNLADIGSPTRLLLNSRADVAAASAAHGVHLTAAPGELTPAQARVVFAAAGCLSVTVSVSCHTLDEVLRAREQQPDLILFGPVFEKAVGDDLLHTGSGPELLAQAVRAAGTVPVLALGGVTPANTPACLAAGAAGVAGIRLFR